MNIKLTALSQHGVAVEMKQSNQFSFKEGVKIAGVDGKRNWQLKLQCNGQKKKSYLGSTTLISVEPWSPAGTYFAELEYQH